MSPRQVGIALSDSMLLKDNSSVSKPAEQMTKELPKKDTSRYQTIANHTVPYRASHSIAQSYCWCFRNPKQPPGMVMKPCKLMGCLPTSQYSQGFITYQHPINLQGIITIPGGAGFLPSTVSKSQRSPLQTDPGSAGRHWRRCAGADGREGSAPSKFMKNRIPQKTDIWVFP